MGRHSAPGDDEDDELLAAPAHGTVADIQLLRDSPALRARCIAAVVVPFALYAVTLIVVGKIGEFVLWVWGPTVVAGVLVGLFLDFAHRRNGTTGATPRSHGTHGAHGARGAHGTPDTPTTS